MNNLGKSPANGGGGAAEDAEAGKSNASPAASAANGGRLVVATSAPSPANAATVTAAPTTYALPQSDATQTLTASIVVANPSQQPPGTATVIATAPATAGAPATVAAGTPLATLNYVQQGATGIRLIPASAAQFGGHPVIVAAPPVLVRDVRRCSDPSRAQQLWDAIKAVRAQKQIPAITRMSRYMNRFYRVKKGKLEKNNMSNCVEASPHILSTDETQRLLNAAVEDNLIKLENKIGTKGSKSGIEERAYRLPTSDMLPRERQDWYCWHCHSGGEVLLCSGCQRVFHESCVKTEFGLDSAKVNMEGAAPEWTCPFCKVRTLNHNALYRVKAGSSLPFQRFQTIPDTYNKRERRDLNNLLKALCAKLREKLPVKDLLKRDIPQPVKSETGDPDDTPPGATGDGIKKCIIAPAPEPDEAWRATFLLKQQVRKPTFVRDIC